jgi:hypothetical protein
MGGAGCAILTVCYVYMHEMGDGHEMGVAIGVGMKV